MAKRKRKISPELQAEHEALHREAYERMTRVLDKIRAEEAAEAASARRKAR